MRIAGIEIGGTKLQIVVGNELGVVDDRVAHVIDASQGASVIRNLIEQSLARFGKVDAIGVGFGGPINRNTGEIWTSYHVEGWTGFNIKSWLGGNVAVDNDANVAALGEALAGAGKDHRVVFYVTLGSGVGGGIVVDGAIYHGKLPGEVEFGHIRLDTSGKILQDSCSGWAVNEKVRAKNLGTDSKALLPAIEKGNKDAIHIFEETMTDLAFGLSHVVHLFHPDTIIIGGGLSFIGEPLRRAVEEKLKLFIMDAFQPGPVIQLSQLKADAVPVGALIMAGQKK
ncbi:MAG TPA: ROK family protein [Cyclobacteriaceae bacterium]|nr:ROK family protein [Cyclobacteriaceae bacterium]